MNINTDFMFRVWDVVNKCYVDDKSNRLYIDSNGYLLINDRPVEDDKYLIEKCTGYKCVDGNYIYVNDYISYRLGLKIIRARVIYDHFGYHVAEICGGYMRFTQQEYTIIGNYNTSPVS